MNFKVILHMLGIGMIVLELKGGILMVGMVPSVWTLLTWRWTRKLIMKKQKLKCIKRPKPHFMKVVPIADLPLFYYY
jgi:hypothetical protein